MNNVDPDFRMMALYDLLQHVNKDDTQLSDSEQSTAVERVLKCFTETEKNNQVVSNAVHVVGPLALKLSERNQEILTCNLARIVGTSNPTMPANDARLLRENAAMSLKLTAQTFTSKDGAQREETLRKTAKTALAVSNSLGRALSSLPLDEFRVRCEVYDVLADFLVAYGGALESSNQFILDASLVDITSDTNSRKRAMSCLARLAPHLSADQFATMRSKLIDGLRQGGKSTRKFIEVSNAVARTAASRFDAPTVAEMVERFECELRRLESLPEDQRDSRDADETREQIFSAFDSIVSNCPAQLYPVLSHVISTSIAHLAWDPNYCDDGDGYAEDEDEEEFDADDGDSSWKVRISSARCLSRILKAFPELPALTIQNIVAAVADRLRERVEQVRIAVMEILQGLVDVARTGSTKIDDHIVELSAASSVHQLSPVGMTLYQFKKSLFERLFAAIAQKKDLKVKLAATLAIKDLVTLFGVTCADELPKCLDSAIVVMNSDPRRQLPQLRPEALALIQRIVSVAYRLEDEGLRMTIFPKIEASLPCVFEALKDRFFRCIVAALRMLQSVALVVAKTGSELKAVDIFRAVVARLQATDSDLEVKKSTIETVAVVVVHLKALLVPQCGAELANVFDSLVALVKSETTRVQACKSIESIVAVVPLSPNSVAAAATELAVLLKKTDRQVRECSLSALIAVIQSNAKVLSVQLLSAVIDDLSSSQEGAAIIDEKNLFIAAQALALASAIARIGAPALSQQLTAKMPAAVCRLLRGTLIQGNALEQCATLFSTIASVLPTAVPELLNRLNEVLRVQGAASTTILNSSMVIGAVAAAAPTQATAISDQYMRETNKIVALACVGAIGRHVALTDNARRFLVDGCSSAEEEVRSVAAISLGRTAASVQNAAVLNDIALILQQPSVPANAHHLLRAIKEAIVIGSQAKSSNVANTVSLCFPATADAILQILLQLATRDDEYLTDVLNECIGRLSSLNISSSLPRLVQALANESPSMKAAAVAAMKYVVPDATEEALVADNLPRFFELFQRKGTLIIRRSCVQLLHCLVMYRPGQLTAAVCANALASLADELEVDKSLVTEVDLGPFKHRVDKGLELRKISFECLHSLLDNAKKGGSVLSCATEAFWNVASNNLASACGAPDEPENEIINSARLAVVKVAKMHSNIFVNFAEKIGGKIVLTLNGKPKDGQDQEKFVDATRIAIFCAARLDAVCPTMKQDAKFAEALKIATASDRYRESLEIESSR